jgi:hypothetical protein
MVALAGCDECYLMLMSVLLIADFITIFAIIWPFKLLPSTYIVATHTSFVTLSDQEISNPSMSSVAVVKVSLIHARYRTLTRLFRKG